MEAVKHAVQAENLGTPVSGAEYGETMTSYIYLFFEVSTFQRLTR